MFQKHKKLIFSQIAAFAAVASLILAFLRHQAVGTWSDQMAGSFLLFAALLFGAEIKLLIDWLKARKAAPKAAPKASPGVEQ